MVCSYVVLFVIGLWCHIDMAYPVHEGERATGWGVSLLFDLCNKL